MTPIDIFLSWFENQDKGIRETIAFQFLSFAPDFDMAKDGLCEEIYTKMKEYLTKDKEALKITGKIIFVQNTINFLTYDYADVDTLIDSQNLTSKVIEKGKSDGHNMDYLENIHKKGTERFEQRKEFKKNWEKFCIEKLNYESIDKFLKLELLKNK